ncbi:MAG: hypothetical protein DHS20C18_55120 [Saprospiraceae bacterium]|nr:MAG: hypothetical protein DHS20C18_55120 [Saprospiraceae bacterium]
MILLLVFCFSSIHLAWGQYSETFDVDDKGVLMGGCSGTDGTTCTMFDFSDVTWTIAGNLNIIEPGSGAKFESNDDFKTFGGVLTTTTGDIDVEVCWVSPILDISSAGNDVDFNLDISYTDFEISDPDYLNVTYSLDGGGFQTVQADLVGTGGRTINGGGTGTQNDIGISGGLSGSTLQIRVCTDFNSTNEAFTLDNVNVPDANVMILPVELMYFDAAIRQQFVTVNWATAKEENNNYFSLERSIDGRDFEEISRLQGAGNANTINNYQFVDKNPKPGTNYYRLKQVDFDGQFEYSRVVSVDFKNETLNIMHLAPNPLNDFLEITMTQELAEGAQFYIFDLNGKMVYQDSWPVNHLKQKIYLNNLPSGIYQLKMITGNDIINQQIVKE